MVLYQNHFKKWRVGLATIVGFSQPTVACAAPLSARRPQALPFLAVDAILDNKSMNTYYKSMKTTVSERGQITLPKAIRTKLGIRPGTIIEFEIVLGKIIGTKKEPEDALRKWRGVGRLPGGFSSVDAYLDEVRG